MLTCTIMCTISPKLFTHMLSTKPTSKLEMLPTGPNLHSDRGIHGCMLVMKYAEEEEGTSMPPVKFCLHLSLTDWLRQHDTQSQVLLLNAEATDTSFLASAKQVSQTGVCDSCNKTCCTA